MEIRKCPFSGRALWHGLVEGDYLVYRHWWECPDRDCDWYEWQEQAGSRLAIGNVLSHGRMNKRLAR